MSHPKEGQCFVFNVQFSLCVMLAFHLPERWRGVSLRMRVNKLSFVMSVQDFCVFSQCIALTS
jgi:hypothetical protein